MNNISACSVENNDIVCQEEADDSEWQSLGCDEREVSGQDIELRGSLFDLYISVNVSLA